jgi:gentisate 1,2-dioxygenase
MTTKLADRLFHVPSLDSLYALVPDGGMAPGWNKPTPSLWAEPRRTFWPGHWRYDEARAALDAAGRLMSTADAERRNLVLVNPMPGNAYGTTRNLVVAYQMIMPGERARSHRHTPNALRLVLDSEPGAYTNVDGRRLAMLPGDVVLTPGWCWHGHGNDGPAPAYWLDYLDVPFVQAVESMFFEPYPGDFEAITAAPARSPFVFPWRETEAALDRTAPDPTGRFGRQIPLVAPSLRTIGLFMLRLEAGTRTKPLQTTANNIYSVVRGQGETTVDGERFDWSRGDVIVAPAWRPHEHHTSADAVLFRVTDAPLLEALGFLRSRES